MCVLWDRARSASHLQCAILGCGQIQQTCCAFHNYMECRRPIYIKYYNHVLGQVEIVSLFAQYIIYVMWETRGRFFPFFFFPFFQNHLVGQIFSPFGPVLARGPPVAYPCHTGSTGGHSATYGLLRPPQHRMTTGPGEDDHENSWCGVRHRRSTYFQM